MVATFEGGGQIISTAPSSTFEVHHKLSLVDSASLRDVVGSWTAIQALGIRIGQQVLRVDGVLKGETQQEGQKQIRFAHKRDIILIKTQSYKFSISR